MTTSNAGANAILSELDALRARVESHLASATGGAARVRAIEKLAGGACQDNFALDVALAAGELAGERRLVLRSDARTSLPGSLDREEEYAVIRAATAVGVKTPEARFLARGLVRDGASAYFLDWADGEAIGRRVLTSPKLIAARAGLAKACAGELARIHAITPRTHPSLFTRRESGAVTQSAIDDPARHACGFVRGMLDRMQEPRPALELALRWLRANAPAPRDVTLVHGDFRTGNFMVTPDGLSAVLDWEFAHWGAPEEDLAWISVRDWRFGQLKSPIGGFADRDPFYAAYEAASGRKVDRAVVHWWEVMGNVRWAASSIHQGERYLSGGDPDIELVAVARRAIEMEYEALRLLPRGGF